jgi:cytochrome c-type biogenesis protein CcmH
MSRFLWVAGLFLLLQAPALAVQPDEMLSDPALEARARALGQDLRCLVCQNQSIDDSDADLAHDLRVLLRQRLAAGDSDAQAKQYLVDRYGDYVLLKPPFKLTTLALWLGPLLLLLLAGAAGWSFYRRRPVGPDFAGRPLDSTEATKLSALLREDPPR